MRRQHRYLSPKSHKRRGSLFYWFAAFLMFALVAWVWWQAGKTTSDPAKSRLQAAAQVVREETRRTATNSTSQGTNKAAAPKALAVPAQSVTNRTTKETPRARLDSSSAQHHGRSNVSQTQPESAIGDANPVVRSDQALQSLVPRTNGGAIPQSSFPRPVRDTMELQIALARQTISPGSVDGVKGSQTRLALLAFQRREGLPTTGALDAATSERLLISHPPLTSYSVTSNDLARLQPVSKTWLGKSQQSALEYETILELVAEKGRASPNLLRRLNPGVDWTNVVTGITLNMPDITNPPPATKGGFVVISLGEKKLQAFDGATNLLAHFPCSIAARVEKRPAGELRVTAIAPNPDYTFNPEVFPESAEARQIKTKLMLPPGPNNPVGTAWISLDLPGYGMHGTPSPEQVGRTESHGCFRLANWNAEFLLKLVWVGMPVYVEP